MYLNVYTPFTGTKSFQGVKPVNLACYYYKSFVVYLHFERGVIQ